MLCPGRTHSSELEQFLIKDKKSFLQTWGDCYNDESQHNCKKTFKNSPIEDNESSGEAKEATPSLSVMEMIAELTQDEFGVKLLELLVISEKSYFADEVLWLYLPKPLSLWTNIMIVSLLTLCAKRCSDDCRIKVFEKLSENWLAICTNPTTSSIAQALIEGSNQSLLFKILKFSSKFLKELVASSSGFFCSIKIADSLSEEGRALMLSIISQQPSVTKNKQGYLVANKLIKKGVSKNAQQSFLDSLQVGKVDQNRNVRKLRKLVED